MQWRRKTETRLNLNCNNLLDAMKTEWRRRSGVRGMWNQWSALFYINSKHLRIILRVKW